MEAVGETMAGEKQERRHGREARGRQYANEAEAVVVKTSGIEWNR